MQGKKGLKVIYRADVKEISHMFEVLKKNFDKPSRPP